MISNQRLGGIIDSRKRKRKAVNDMIMDGTMSTLPDSVVCHILSFLPTKVSVATCVLSKQWKHLWRSVPTLHFECAYVNDTNFCSVDSVRAFVHSRDLQQSLLRFQFRCCNHSCYLTNVYTLVTTAAQNKLQELDLLLDSKLFCKYEPVSLPSAVLSCKTLVVLKLTFLHLEAFSSVDLPSLKILHLMNVTFPDYRLLAKLLSGCLNLEDLIVNNINFKSSAIELESEFKNLPKLIRAVIDKCHIPLQVVSNVQFLRVNQMDQVGDYGVLIPEYHNLTHIELGYCQYGYWQELLRLLNHCPKVQSLIITQEDVDEVEYAVMEDLEFTHWVPKCLSLQLKTCCINHYCGSKIQFEFAKYILQNARVLEDMTICSYNGTGRREKFRMIKKLCLCTRLSSTCKLSFG